MNSGISPDRPRSRLARAIAAIEDAVLVTVVAAMILLAAAQILLRNGFDSGFAWGDPLLRVLVLWAALVGAMVATREDNQITIDILSRYLPERGRLAARIVTDLFAAAVSAVVAWQGLHFVRLERADGVIAFAAVPAWICEAIIPIGFAAIAVRYLLYSGTRLKAFTAPS